MDTLRRMDTLTRLSITDAINFSQISRATFYRRFLDTGVISIKVDSTGKKYIEATELLRVCPDIKVPQSETSVTVSMDNMRQPDTSSLEVEARLLREQLQEYKTREKRLLDQLDKMTSLVLQLEYRPTPTSPPLAVAPEPTKPVATASQSSIKRYLLYEKLLQSADYSVEELLEVAPALENIVNL